MDAAVLRPVKFDRGFAQSPCKEEEVIQQPVRHFPADGQAVVLVQGSPARRVAQLEEYCRSGRSPDEHCWARIDKIQANSVICLALLCLMRTTYKLILRIGQKQKQHHTHGKNVKQRG